MFFYLNQNIYTQKTNHVKTYLNKFIHPKLNNILTVFIQMRRTQQGESTRSVCKKATLFLILYLIYRYILTKDTCIVLSIFTKSIITYIDGQNTLYHSGCYIVLL
jgi:hypothetical protein